MPTPLRIFLELEDDFPLLELPPLRPPAVIVKSSAKAISCPSSTEKDILESVILPGDMTVSAYPFPNGSVELGEYAR